MRKQKIYLETTVFNYYFDEDRDEHRATVKLFEEIKQGKFEAYTSGLVILELGNTKDSSRRKKMLGLVNNHSIQILDSAELG